MLVKLVGLFNDLGVLLFTSVYHKSFELFNVRCVCGFYIKTQANWQLISSWCFLTVEYFQVWMYIKYVYNMCPRSPPHDALWDCILHEGYWWWCLRIWLVLDTLYCILMLLLCQSCTWNAYFGSVAGFRKGPQCGWFMGCYMLVLVEQ